MINRYSAYGDYADNYCEDWAPAGAPALFTADGATFAPSRMPGYPVYVMSWQQPVEQSAGGDTVVGDPYLQEMLIQLSWAGMSGVDKAALESFFKDGVCGMTKEFSYFNPMTGPALPVRFAESTLPAMPEIAYDRYAVSLSLRVCINYPQSPLTSGPPPALTGNRFVLGGVAMSFPLPLRPSTGYGITKPQTLERNSAGNAVIYSKSTLTLQQHRLSLALTFDGWVSLQAFFFTFAHGRRNRFTWYDHTGVARTVRLAGSQISVRQAGYNRYETEFNLVEEI